TPELPALSISHVPACSSRYAALSLHASDGHRARYYLNEGSPARKLLPGQARKLTQPMRRTEHAGLAFPKSAVDLIREGFCDIGQDGSFAGADEAFHRHAGNKAQAIEAGNLAFRERDVYEIVGSAGALVGGQVRRDAADDAVEFRR